jgi:hypothetical protein
MDVYQRIQNQMQKIPGLKSVGTYIESTGAARGQEKLGNSIPMAMVKRDLTVGRQASEARAGLLGWAGGPEGQSLGIDPKGIARAVEVKPGANIPKGIVGRLDDIVEHPEDYNLTPEQTAALVPIKHTLDAVTQHAQAAGVDVNEVSGPYFPRKILSGPAGDTSGVSGGIGNRLTSKPGFAKMRVFPDTRSAVAAGYKVASPIEALGDRLITGVQATANKEAYKSILPLGEKPSTRLSPAATQGLLDAREAYKAARASGDQRALALASSELDAAKSGLRKAALRAATPQMGETLAYGRVFPQSVTNELAKYSDVSGPGVIDQFFNIQRANETTGDHSSMFVQGGNLLYRNPVAWLKSAAYSTVSAVHEPWGWASRNMDAIDAAIKDGAAQPPSEFLLSHGITSGEFGPNLTRPITRFATTPLRAAQRMFEWNVFMGQIEWHKAAVRMDMTAAERQDLGAVIRKGMGSSSQPGLTNAMRTFDKRLWYAGGFMRSTLGLMADASRAGVRGAEARKTLGMVVGGATAATIAMQYAVDGTMPNLTDPNRTDKRWGYVEFPGGGVNLYGPLFPYMRLIGKAGQDLQKGQVGTPADLMGGAPGSATGELGSLVSGKLALPIRTAIDLRRGETFVGDKIAPGWKGTLQYLGQQTYPLGIRQATEGAMSGQLQQFPEQGAEVLGARTTPNSDYQMAVRDLASKGGDFSGAYNAAVASGDQAKANSLISLWRQDFIQKAKPFGVTVIPGDVNRAPSVAIDSVDRNQNVAAPEWRDVFKAKGLDLPNLDQIATYADLRKAYVDYATPIFAQKNDVSLQVAHDQASAHFASIPAIVQYAATEKRLRLNFWKAHPDLLTEAADTGVETLNKDEKAIYDAYKKAQTIAGNGQLAPTP